jgi:hypothetical protein
MIYESSLRLKHFEFDSVSFNFETWTFPYLRTAPAWFSNVSGRWSCSTWTFPTVKRSWEVPMIVSDRLRSKAFVQTVRNVHSTVKFTFQRNIVYKDALLEFNIILAHVNPSWEHFHADLKINNLLRCLLKGQY